MQGAIQVLGFTFTFTVHYKSDEMVISLQRGPVDPKFQVKGVTSHQPFFFSEN